MNRWAKRGMVLLLCASLFSCKSKAPGYSTKDIRFHFAIGDHLGKKLKVQLLKSGEYNLLCFDKNDQKTKEYIGQYNITEDSLVFLDTEELSPCLPQFAIRNGQLLLFETLESSEKPIELSSSNEDRIGNYEAFGDEPFWSITIDNQELLHLRTLDNAMLDLKISLREAALNMRPEKKIIEIIENDIELSIVIYSESCSGTMKGESFDNKVELNIRPKPENAVLRYKGCGQKK